jgi:hypothetical protein
MVDRKGPTVTCGATPTFTLNEAGATVSAAVSDGGSGAASPSVTTAVSTATAGSHSASLTGFDNVGNSTTVGCPYNVVYVFTGFFAPVNNPDTVNTGKAGRTYPVKWRLSDANGNLISALSAVASIAVKGTSCASFDTNPESALETTTTGGTALRYDSTANQYVYNWATSSKGCFTLFLTLDDGTTHSAFFSLS